MCKRLISAAILSKIPEDTAWEINAEYTELKWWRKSALSFAAAETILENLVDEFIHQISAKF